MYVASAVNFYPLPMKAEADLLDRHIESGATSTDGRQKSLPDEETGLFLSGKTALVVDDNPGDVDLSRELLKERGCLVLSASSAQEAVTIMRAIMVKILFTDWHMAYSKTDAPTDREILARTPQEGGRDVIRVAKKLGVAHIIATSSVADGEVMMAAGADGVVPKGAEDLAEKVRDLIARVGHG